MANKIQFRAVPPYRVLLNGDDFGSFETQAEALQEAIELAGEVTSPVEVVGGTGISIRVEATPETPEDPEPEDPEPEKPDEPETPKEPEEPPTAPPPIDYSGDHPFYPIAATLAPNEIRRVPVTKFPEGVKDMARMNNTSWFLPGASGTFGVGWTDRMVFDLKHTGRIYNVLLREDARRSITWLEPDLSMNGVPAPEEAGLTRRRPFNRLCSDGDYLYFAPSIPGNEIGRLTRCHLTTPDQWEDVGAPPLPVDVSGKHGAGDFCLSWFPELGKFVLYTQGSGRGDKSPEGVHTYEGGRVWLWGPNDDAWVLIGRTQSCGYAGSSIYNPIRKEVLCYGGSTAYSNPHPLGGECTATVDVNGVLTRHGPSGLFVSAGNRRVGYHPVTGDYIVMDQEEGRVTQRIWIGDPPRGKPWRLMHRSKRGEVFDNYEGWQRVCALPGTDCIIWADHRRGYFLHKPLAWDDLTDEDNIDRVLGENPEPDDDGPDDPEGDNTPPDEPETPEEPEPPVIIDPPPPAHDGEFPSMAGTVLDTLAAQCEPGGTVLITGGWPAGMSEWKQYRDHQQSENRPTADMQTWGAKGLWDRVRQGAYYVGDRTGNNKPIRMTFHRYDAVTGHWDHLSLDMPNARRQVAQPHTYGQQAIDDRRGTVYYGPDPDQVNRFRFDRMEWEHIALNPNSVKFGAQSPCIWHEGLDMLLVAEKGRKNIDDSVLYGWRDGMARFEEIGVCGHDSYHSHFVYNRKRGDALMLGGNENPRRVTLIHADGTAQRMKDAPETVGGLPFAFSVGRRNATYDPASGNYLMFDRDRIIWEYSPDRDEWAIGKDCREEGWSGPYHGNVGIPIDGTDYMVWYSYYTPRIYKHVAVLV